MGTLSQALYKIGVKGDIIGHASSPNMLIPPPIEIEQAKTEADRDADTVDELFTSTTTSTLSTSSNSAISAKVSDEEEEDEKDNSLRRSSVHPGNSVWLAHSF